MSYTDLISRATGVCTSLLICAAVDNGIQAGIEAVLSKSNNLPKSYNFSRSVGFLQSAAVAYAITVSIENRIGLSISDIALANLRNFGIDCLSYPLARQAGITVYELATGKEFSLNGLRFAQNFIAFSISPILICSTGMHPLKLGYIGSGIITGIVGAKEIIKGFWGSNSKSQVESFKFGTLCTVASVALFSLGHYAL